MFLTYLLNEGLWDRIAGGLFPYMVPKNRYQSFIQIRDLKVKTLLVNQVKTNISPKYKHIDISGLPWLKLNRF